MARFFLAALAAVLLLATVRAGELSVHTVQETTQPEGRSGTYAILQDGRLVGVVRRYQASALGRRAGPFADDHTLPGDARPARMAGIVGILRSRLDFVNAVQDQLQATRCPYARQMMLAQMQAAAAAQALQQDGFEGDGLEGDNDGMTEPHHHHMMFGGPEGLPWKQRAEGIPRGPHHDPFHGPHGPFHGPHGPFPEVMHEHGAEGVAHKGPHFAEHAREPHMGPREMPAERPMNFGHGPLFVRSRDAAEAAPGARPLTRPMLLMRGPNGGWAELENTAEPAPGAEPELNWQLWNEDHTLNWGLLTFVTLASACATVWGIMVLHCCTFARCAARTSPRSCFITSTGSANAAALQPLLREGHLQDLSPKGGVESAAAHVPAAQQNVTVLHYEPLKM